MIGHLLTAHFKDAPKDTQVNSRCQINPHREILGFKNLPKLLFFEIFSIVFSLVLRSPKFQPGIVIMGRSGIDTPLPRIISYLHNCVLHRILLMNADQSYVLY